LQTFEFQVLQVRLVLAIELRLRGCFHFG
jgi:hypothetical protein